MKKQMKNPFASVAILAISIIICLTNVFGLAACSTADNSIQRPSTEDTDTQQPDSGTQQPSTEDTDTQQPVTDKYARLRQAYDKVKLQYSSATLCYEIGDDGSYIEVDTNPLDFDDFYNPTYTKVIEAFNEELGVPDYVYKLMITTTALQGRQTETVNGLIISWTYHPDNGLEVIYRLAD